VADTDAPYDVLISGAGPAGIATAVALAARAPAVASRMICLDRARFPRTKPCGGGLTGHARAALRALGLSVRVPHVACTTGRLIYGGALADVPLAQPVDVVRREELDADLVAQARARGIEIVEGEGIDSVAVDGPGRLARVTTSAGRTLRARVVVGADGVGSRVRKLLLSGAAAPSPLPALHLFKAELDAPPGLRLGARMIYDFSAMDDGLRGYIWLFPVAGGRVNVGAMHYPSRYLPAAAVERLLVRCLDRHGVTLGAAPVRRYPAWQYDRAAPIAGPHLLCVGDAAGIDALTGEGIAVGLEQGMVAAAAIARAVETGDYRFAGYRAAVRAATVGRELALDRWAAAILYAPGGVSLALSMVMFDERVQALYAARVSGSAVLADAKGALLSALLRHAALAPARLRRLFRARETPSPIRTPGPT
jgi:flavin-dependent dehydrogenase